MSQTAGKTLQESSVEVDGESVAASLGLNLNLFIFQFINFAIVALVVWYLILKPLTRKLEERQKMIEKSVEDAKRIESNMVMSDQKYQERIDTAKIEANKIVGRAHEEAEVFGEKMKDKAKADVEQLIKQAKVKIGEEKEKMMVELKIETAALVVAAVEKVLYQKLDNKKDAELVEKTVRSVSSRESE